MSDMKFHRTFLIFREREPGVWVFMDETVIWSTHTLEHGGVEELVARSFMAKSHNHGGKFAVVPKETWELVEARSRSAEVQKVEAS